MSCGAWGVWGRTLGAVAVALAACGPVQAFYWHDWPGSRVSSRPTILTTTRTITTAGPPNSTANPPSTPPPDTTPVPTPPGNPKTPPPPVGPPVGGDKPPVGPSQTPEPGTALLGAIGLGAMAVVRRLKKRK